MHPTQPTRSFILAVLLIALSYNALAKSSHAILLKSTTISPPANLQSFIDSPNIDPKLLVNSRYYRLVQFDPLPNDQQKAAFEQTGAQLLDYLPHATYWVSFPENYDRQQLTQFNIRSIIPMPVTGKLDPRLLWDALPDWAVRSPSTIDLIIQPMKGLDATNIALTYHLEEQGITVLAVNPWANTLQVRLTNTDFLTIATLPFIAYLEPIPPDPEPEDTPGRTMHRSNVLATDYGAGRHYDGTGVSIAINDDGLVGPHIDFTGRIDQTEVAGFDIGTHGDMTTGIAVGAGNLDPTIKGMAYGAFVHVRDYNASLPNTVPLHNNDNIMIFSSSYSNGCNAGYTTVTQMVDEEIYDNPTLLQTFSAGNSNNSDCGYGAGTAWGNITGGHKIAKNVIATANLSNEDVIQNSSSRGPASDGRLKPDISAHGNNQMSTDPNNTYAPGGGTSAAAPGIAGVTAQLIQAYRNLNGGNDAESGLLKACLLNTAEDLGNPGPDYIFGWGRVNGGKAVELLENNQYLDASIAQGAINSHTVNVPANTKQVRIMLYWMDPEGSTNAALALVNNLDLTVTDPNSTTYSPLVLDPTPNPANLDTDAVPGIDTLNNVEQVTIDAPVAGNYTVSITGTEVPVGPQKYYIVYAFVQDAITLTYPLGGEGFVPGETEKIRWDAYGINGNFTLEYSADNGGSWNNVASNVGGGERFYDWTVPNNITGAALFRVSRGGDSDVSPANFSIIGVPQSLVIDYSCPDSFQLSWAPVTGATQYEVSILGAKYMDPVGTTSNTAFVFHGYYPNDEQWVSVKALGPNGLVGRRAIAIQKAPGTFNCIVPVDAEVAQLISPAPGTHADCGGANGVVVSINLKNNGNSVATGIPVSYQFNGSTTVTETYTGSLAAGDSTVFEFSTTINIPGSSTNDLITWTGLNGDGNHYNDTVQGTISLVSGTMITAPWTEDLESFQECSIAEDCAGTVCSLANGWTNLVNGVEDDIDWRTDDNGTFSSNTGPNQDHNPGTNNGNYVYLEASNWCNYEVAEMISPCIDLSTTFNAEFSYWYHLYGNTMGELHVDILSDFAWDLDVVPMLSGDQGNQWTQQTIDLAPYNGKVINIRFRGITGPERRSDMALDDFSLSADLNAHFGYSGTTCENEVITFIDSSSGGPLEHHWDFGKDASPDTAYGAGPHFVTYSSPGTKQVLLNLSDGSGTDSQMRTISIANGNEGIAQFTHNIQGNGLVKFTNTILFADSYFWDFGDGSTETVASPTHQYTSSQSYSVMSVVNNSCGADTVIEELGILIEGLDNANAPLLIEVMPNPSEGQFLLQLQHLPSSTVQIEVLNLQGQQVYAASLNNTGSSVQHWLDLSQLERAVYLMQVTTDQGNARLKLAKL